MQKREKGDRRPPKIKFAHKILAKLHFNDFFVVILQPIY